MSTEHDNGPSLDEVEHRLTVAEVGLRGDVVCVAVTGELDIGTAAVLQRRLSEILDGRPGHGLEFDLSALEFCDLTGLRALDALDQPSAHGWRHARIATASPALDLLLDLCQTSRFLGYTPAPAPRDAEGF